MDIVNSANTGIQNLHWDHLWEKARSPIREEAERASKEIQRRNQEEIRRKAERQPDPLRSPYTLPQAG